MGENMLPRVLRMTLEKTNSLQQSVFTDLQREKVYTFYLLLKALPTPSGPRPQGHAYLPVLKPSSSKFLSFQTNSLGALFLSTPDAVLTWLSLCVLASQPANASTW